MRTQAFQDRSESSSSSPTAIAPGKRSLTAQITPSAQPRAAQAKDQAAQAHALGAVQAKAAANDGAMPGDPFALHLAGGSDRLPPALQAKMGAAFGADFSSVRVHQDGAAAAIGAQAYASGEDLHFAPGHYDPDSARGQELIGHELAHVVQQRSGRVGGDGLVVDHGLEHEADVDGARAARGEVVGRGGAASGPVSGSGGAVQGKLIQANPLAALPALGAMTSTIAADVFAWAGAEANATAIGTLLSLAGTAGGAIGGIGNAIQPGTSDVQKYCIQPFQTAGAADMLEMYIQVQLINAFMRQWAAANPPSANCGAPATGTPAPAPVTGGPATGTPAPAPITGGPAPGPTPALPAPGAPAPGTPATAPAQPEIDPAVLAALQTAALADVKVRIAQEIDAAVKTGSSDEYVWSDSGAKTPDSLGTVGSIILRNVRSYGFVHTLMFDPIAKAIPLIAASGLDGKVVKVFGITSGDLQKGPSWSIGYGDSLAVNVQSQVPQGTGVQLNTTWDWDGGTTYMTIGVNVRFDGTPEFREVKREGTPDDNSWY